MSQRRRRRTKGKMVGRRKRGRRRNKRRIEEEKQVVQETLPYQGKQLLLESIYPPPQVFSNQFSPVH